MNEIAFVGNRTPAISLEAIYSTTKLQMLVLLLLGVVKNPFFYFVWFIAVTLTIHIRVMSLSCFFS